MRFFQDLVQVFMWGVSNIFKCVKDRGEGSINKNRKNIQFSLVDCSGMTLIGSAFLRTFLCIPIA